MTSLFSHWPLRQDHIPYYLQLIRFDRPIGTLLLLYPCLTALMIAGDGKPSIKNLIIFSCGTFLMRSAGCAINDFADRHWDGKVTRTQNRPLAQKKIAPIEAVLLALILAAISFILVLFTNWQTIALSFAAVGLAALYPFTKRFTQMPQLFLGLAFAWSIPMSYTAESHPFTTTTWLLLIATILWTLAYDTMYAMVDRLDDLQAGIKSSAILFGRWDRLIVAILQTGFITLLSLISYINSFGIIIYLAIVAIAFLFVYQQVLIYHQKPSLCFKAFLNNQWVGFFMLAGSTLEYYF